MLCRKVAIMPVLTEEAVVTARAIKNRQIVIAVFCRRLIRISWIASASASRTKPPADTVGGQTIIIPF